MSRCLLSSPVNPQTLACAADKALSLLMDLQVKGWPCSLRSWKGRCGRYGRQNPSGTTHLSTQAAILLATYRFRYVRFRKLRSRWRDQQRFLLKGPFLMRDLQCSLVPPAMWLDMCVASCSCKSAWSLLDPEW